MNIRRAKIILTIIGIIAIYVFFIYCIRVFPLIHDIVKWILFLYIMLIIAVYLLGGIVMHFDMDKNNAIGTLFWYMTWGMLAIIPFGIAIIF